MARYLRTGAIAGLVAGMALALFLITVGERSLGQAVQLQTARAIADTAPDQMFTRGAQLLGGVLGSMIFGLGVGAIFGVVYAAIRHRLPGRDDWERALWLAVGGLIVLWVVRDGVRHARMASAGSIELAPGGTAGGSVATAGQADVRARATAML